MARVLQIRRGTTAQNDNFTGLAGELSFDTDAKTLRVHDGVKLGGYVMARADGSTGGTDFDIATVPDDFWTDLFGRFETRLKRSTSFSIPLKATAYREFVFDLQVPAIFARAALVCQVAQAGYSVDDEVWAFGVGDRTNPMPNTFLDASGLHVRLLLGNEALWVSHKDTGVTTNITNANWGLQFSVWY